MEEFEQKENVSSPEAYFSVSHLLNRIYVKSGNGQGEPHYVVIAGNTKNGKVKYQAIGGGAKLTHRGQDLLTGTYGADIRFREGEESDDARFYIKIPPDVDRNSFIRGTIEPFLELQNGFIENSITRELKEELFKVAPDLESMFTNGDLPTSYIGVVSPMPNVESGSQRSNGADLYQRVFHLFDLTLTQEQFAVLMKSSEVRDLSREDIAEIHKGTSKGNTIVELRDGTYVAENVFLINSV